MKISGSLIIIFFLFIGEHMISAQADDICGYWRTIKGNAQIEVYKEKDGTYSGKVVWLRIEKDRPDIYNENESLRTRKIFGLRILQGLIYDARQHRWKKGNIYDPQTGKNYHCHIELEHDKNILVLKGYIPGLKMLNKENRWIRENKLRL